MRRIVTSFLVSDQHGITIIFHRNVEFENVLNIGWWLAAVSACGDPHDLCYLHDTAEGGYGQARLTIAPLLAAPRCGEQE